MSYGNQGHMGISAQESFGTITTSFDFFPFISETITVNIEDLPEEGMEARFEEGESHEGLQTITGDISLEPHPIMIGHLFRGVQGQSSGTIVDSVTEWGFKGITADFTPNVCALPPFTIEIYRDAGLAWRIQDTVINTLNVEIAGGALVKATAGIIGRVSSLAAKATPTFLSDDPFVWDQASISIGGVANGDHESINFTIDNQIEGVTLIDGNKFQGRYKRGAGFRQYTAGGTIDFSTQSQYLQFRNSSQQALIATITGKTEVSSGRPEVLKFDIPAFRYTTYPVPMAGPGRVTVAYDGKWKFHPGSVNAGEVTLVNTRLAYTP